MLLQSVKRLLRFFLAGWALFSTWLMPVQYFQFTSRFRNSPLHG
ncbi:hypothetical protein L686_05685 [Stutzerimonas stutzeri MF28]|nr:hypothetical protein L686_05685 [Stutzerimonas stutzeri MF28]